MSGPFVFAAAAAYPERFAATASIYGAGLLTDEDDSPHLDADRIQGEIYFARAEIDCYAPKEQIDALAAHLAETKVNHRIEWYPGVEHDSAFPQREGPKSAKNFGHMRVFSQSDNMSAAGLR